MNGFFPQSIQASTELELIANVKNQIVGAKDSNPIIGCVQDGVTGAYLMTLDDVKVSGEEAHYLLSRAEYPDLYKIDKNKTYTGKEVFSMIIPKGINSFKKKGDKYIFRVKDGELLNGNMTKSTIASKKNSLIHFVYDKKGGNSTRMFVDDTQRTVLNYLMLRGFTVGFGDCLIGDEKIEKQIKDTLINSIQDNQYDITNMENQGTSISYDIYEDSLYASLNSLGGNTYKMVTDNLKPENNFHVLAIGGQAKGKGLNIGQIMSCLGQQSVEGKRVRKKVNGRALAHFPYNDDSAFARGFVASSFLEGMKGYEYFFHSMGGREGLIDTAIKTASTGYIQRKLIKALEDLRVTYDGTVRNSNGIIVEFLYGDNGIDQLVQSSNRISTITLSNKEMENRFLMNDKELKQTKSDKKIQDKYYKEMRRMRDLLRNNIMKANMETKVIDDTFLLPVNLYRIVQEYTDDDRKLKYDLNVNYILEKIDEILNDPKTDLLAKRNKEYQNKDEQKAKTLFKLALYEYLSPRRCVYEFHFNKQDFDNLVDDVKKAFLKAVVQPGEMVGVITAQSIGEPTTQLNLNTKHFAGVAKAGSSGTSGVSRIDEILSFSKNIKTPMATLYLKEINNDVLGKRLNNHLNSIKINDLVSKAEIYYDAKSSNNLDQILANDKVDNPFYFNNTKKNLDLFSWVFRLELDREILLDKEVVLIDIKTKIVLFYYQLIQDIRAVKKDQKDIWESIIGGAVLSNQDTSDNPVIHIRIGFKNFNYPMITKLLKILLNEVYLKGVKGIENAGHSKDMRIIFNSETGEMETKKDYENVIVTQGINLDEVRTLKGIDQERVYLNDLKMVLDLFGIEAARSLLITELRRTFSGGGANFNYNHLAVLADLMTYTGSIISIDRHGTNKMELDPLARASFERTMEQFVNASIFNQKDKIRATSSRVMTGRVIPGGTGAFELILDTEKLANSEFLDDEYQGRKLVDGFNDNPLFKDIMENDDVNIDFLM